MTRSQRRQRLGRLSEGEKKCLNTENILRPFPAFHQNSIA